MFEDEMGFSLNPLHDISGVLHAGEHIAGKVLHAGEKVAESGAKDFANAMKDAAKAVTHMSPSQIGHTALDVVGMVPVVGTVANLANAGWYAAQGDWKDAAWSAAAAIPVEGDVADAAKLGKDAVSIAEDGAKAERVVNGTEVASTGGSAAKTLSADERWGDAATHGLSTTQSNVRTDVKAARLNANRVAGDAWEKEAHTSLAKTQDNVRTQITIKSNGPSGLKTRMDDVGTGKVDGRIKLTEHKASPDAALTDNQKVVHPELETYGGTVVGKGKPPYVGGTQIPPTHVDVNRKPAP